ncbi:MAG: class I adenylate-forming enzyme family protein [Acidimicrobiales bacterium]
MNRLVALAVPGGPRFVEELRRAWDDGDAVLPLDLRLPPGAIAELLHAMAPAALVDGDGRSKRPHGIPVEPGDALVVATSGTTGAPKGAVLTHAAVAASAEATSAYLGVEPARHRWLACLPLAHVGGLSVLTRALHTGTPVEVHPGFDADAVMAAARNGATHVSLVATALKRIDPTVFEKIVLGGGPAPSPRPPNASVTYGLTETGSGLVYDGRPLPGVEVRVCDGELWVRGPMLLRAYRNGADPKDADGWLATGDGGEVDPAGGEVRVFGRRSEVINTGAEKVWPGPVERLLAEHPAVAEAAVVGRPDPEWGQAVTAIVAPADPGSPPSLEQLRAYVRERLSPWHAPRRLELVAALPKTSLGKVRRHLL